MGGNGSVGRTKAYTRRDWTEYWRTGPDTRPGHYWRMFWQPIHRSQDLPVGRALPIRFAGEDFTLYRGDAPPPQSSPSEGGGGRVHLLAFRCAHRGTQLSTGWVEGDNLRCFYHGWMYDASGQCVEQPAEPEPFCEKIRIRACPTREYLGLVFAYFGEGEPPEFPRFPEFEDEEEGVLEAYTYGRPWNANVFNSLENDPFHGAWVHRESYIASGRVGIPTVRCEETEFGYTTIVRLPDEATHWQESQTHFHMPNASWATRTAPELGPRRLA